MRDLTNYEQVVQFTRVNNLPCPDELTWVSPEVQELRDQLLTEELNEFYEALDARDFVELADALGDILYIVYGTAAAYGIPIDLVFKEIHRSNMTKLGDDGKPIYNEYGKVMKGPNYTPPDIEAVLTKAGFKIPR